MASRQELLEELEKLAFTSESAIARLHALKTLLELDEEKPAGSEGFERLYGDELAPRRNRSAA